MEEDLKLYIGDRYTIVGSPSSHSIMFQIC
jgi:hypothetical protein